MTWRLEGDCSFLEHEDGGSKLVRNLNMCQSIWRYMPQPWIFVNTAASTTTPERLYVLKYTVLTDTQLTVWLSRGRDRTQLDLQMRSATVIRFFKMMLRAWDEVRPFAYLLAGLNVSCVVLQQMGQPARSWAELCGKLPANYRLPALNHCHCPPGAPHACVSDWSNQLYTLTHRVRHMPLADFGQF